MHTTPPLINSHSRPAAIFLTIFLFLVMAFKLIGPNARNEKNPGKNSNSL